MLDRPGLALNCRHNTHFTHFHFVQDGGSYCGVHARDPAGNFITIIDNDPNVGSLIGETSGIAFSPDAVRMYVSYQTPGIVFEIRRTDGQPFSSATAAV